MIRSGVVTVSNALGQPERRRDSFLISDFIIQCQRVRQSCCKENTRAESMGELKRAYFGGSTHMCVQFVCHVGQGIIPFVVLRYGSNSCSQCLKYLQIGALCWI